MNNSPLSLFHPLIGRWFTEKVGTPTDIQVKTWPEIAKQNHVLLTAPTGCGKTLTAFLWALNNLITGVWAPGKVSVLYISPLKALNNDIQKNLLTPLEELREYFTENNEDFPEIRVLTRSGDTPGNERQKMLRRPPEILITTPESLNILLTSKNSRKILMGLETVILDEIHAVCGTKRGTHLMTAVDRLYLLSGEFQRIGISATVRPMETVAEFIGGYQLKGTPPDCSYKKRDVKIIRSTSTKKYRIKVCFPPDAKDKSEEDTWWPMIIRGLKEIIYKNTSTLIFTNNRRLAEKVTRFINEDEDEKLAYAHHGSLSKELRLAVEQKLKKGELKAIVATNSLELGIDVGKLDEVVLIQAPFSISSAIQRVGRAGHKVGETSRAYIYPTHGRDFLESAITAKAIFDQNIEEVRPVECPLDILAQIILSMTIVDEWNIDELYAFLRAGYPYRRLTRAQFDIVLEMLAGRYADSRIRELKPHVTIDKIENTIKARDNISYLIYMSGGTIADRGHFNLRMVDTKAKIGELDEEFVWERSLGDTFVLGSQLWRIHKITHNDVEVAPANTSMTIVPFWRAMDMNRPYHYSEVITNFLEGANRRLDDEDFFNQLVHDHYMEDDAAEQLIRFLQFQKEVTKADLPHRHNILIEHFDDPLNKSDSKQVILHTLWGGSLNMPFSQALAGAWQKKYNYPLEIFSDNNAIMLMLPHEFKIGDVLSLVEPDNIETLLRERLENTGYFGAKFRENAGRALLLPRANFKKRMPLWLNRLRSKKLLEAVMPYEDFPILLETWRECIHDDFDIGNLKLLLDEMKTGKIKISEAVTEKASPFSASLIWRQTNYYMYEDDTPNYSKKSNLDQNLFKEILFSSNLRPMIPLHLIAQLDSKLKRTMPGYTPAPGPELTDWIKERLLVPGHEWEQLIATMSLDHEVSREDIGESIKTRVIMVRFTGFTMQYYAAIESLPLLLNAFSITMSDLDIVPVLENDAALAQKVMTIIKKYVKNNPAGDEYDFSTFLTSFISYYAPVGKESFMSAIPAPPAMTADALDELASEKLVVIDTFGEDSTELEICDTENLEILLRMTRRASRPAFKPLSLDYLPLYIATYQGITMPGSSIDDLQDRLDQLFGYPLPAGAWEEYVLPARLETYYSSWMDSLLQSSGLIYFGCGTKKVSFAFYEDMELYCEHSDSAVKKRAELKTFMPDSPGKFSFFDITGHSGLNSHDAGKKLWDYTWKTMITNDSMETLRKGILNNFSPDKTGEASQSKRRAGFNRWKASRPMQGNWYTIDLQSSEYDILDKEELIKDRIRQLFNRYGILFRELLAHELPLLRWRDIFKSLRLMELSGEILSGCFFENINGLQFISHEAYRFLQRGLNDDVIYWLNAYDPASLCGIKLEVLKQNLPSRLPSTYMVFHGKKLVINAKSNCKKIDIFVKSGNPVLQKYFGFFKGMLARQFNPLNKIFVETINGHKSITSEYCDDFKQFGFRSTYKGLELWKK